MEKTPNIAQIRNLVQSRLGRMVNDSDATIGQLYLISNNRLVGLNFLFGPFVASWRFAEPSIKVMRDGRQIMLIGVEGVAEVEMRRAA